MPGPGGAFQHGGIGCSHAERRHAPRALLPKSSPPSLPCWQLLAPVDAAWKALALPPAWADGIELSTFYTAVPKAWTQAMRLRARALVMVRSRAHSHTHTCSGRDVASHGPIASGKLDLSLLPLLSHAPPRHPPPLDAQAHFLFDTYNPKTLASKVEDDYVSKGTNPIPWATALLAVGQGAPWDAPRWQSQWFILR